jgi:periplasmic protein TonB
MTSSPIFNPSSNPNPALTNAQDNVHLKTPFLMPVKPLLERGLMAAMVISVHGMLLAAALLMPPTATVPPEPELPTLMATVQLAPSSVAPIKPTATPPEKPAPIPPKTTAPVAKPSPVTPSPAPTPPITPPIPVAVIATASTTAAAVDTVPIAAAVSEKVLEAPASKTPPAPPAAPKPQPAAAAAPSTTKAIFDAAYLNNPEPAYPNVSRQRGESGTVFLRVQVSPDGKASSVVLHRSSGHSKLDDAAIKAVNTWRFVPAKTDGVAISSDVIVPIQFKLN